LKYSDLYVKFLPWENGLLHDTLRLWKRKTG